MKKSLAVLFLAATFSPFAHASEPAEKPEAAYTAEAPLPKNWPQPGPYDVVSEKSYPKYRAAFTKGSWQNITFMRLFGHIKKKDIPMTSPVEMDVEKKEGKMDKTGMAFLYQDTEVGQVGADGKNIEVRDVPAQKVLSYAWMGRDSKSNITTARKALEASLEEKKLKADSFRLFGYNGPGVPDDKKTWELQAILPAEK